ncbi:hypothetical protein ACFE04_003433 [Oxalis oulophora]
MEVLPCPDVQYAGDSDPVHQNSAAVLMCDGEGEADFFEPEKQFQNAEGGEDFSLVNVEIEKQVEDQEIKEIIGDLSLFEDFENGDSQNFGYVPSSDFGCNVVVDTIENEILSSNVDGGASLSAPKWLDHDEPVALWVKVRGKWQTGVRCPRDDWPLATIKAKPTHDRKQLIVMFFPHSKNFLWVDSLAVRPIYEYPEPIAYKTHKTGLKLIRDLTVARRYIMKSLAIGVLNIVDQFHFEAVMESAREISTWKEFAMEFSRCSGYSDLGGMLLKLQNMILQQYMNSDWLQNYSNSWVHRCQNADTAETIELLKEELFDSILWSDVKSLSDAPMLHTLGNEWRNWKSEVMKCFSTSHPMSSTENFEQKHSDVHLSNSFPVSVKRQKLEIRRAEPHSSQITPIGLDQPMAVEIDTLFFNQDTMMEPETRKDENFAEGIAMIDSQTSITDRWDDILVQTENSEPIQTNTLELTPINEKKSLQCSAFVEAKGRPCVRWANEGEIYCCVHLTSRSTSSSKKPESPIETPFCSGTTVLGTRCKHRSLVGFTFCKKHRPHGNSISFEHEEVNHVRELSDIIGNSKEAEIPYCIGLYTPGGVDNCREIPKRYSLYCDNHLPSWLKRARNGKSRIISKEVFLNLLRDCSSVEQKCHLHKACELFYKLYKNILSVRNAVPLEVELERVFSEACKNFSVGNMLMKLVSREKERLLMTWHFGADESAKEEPNLMPPATDGNREDGNEIKCKFCLVKFVDDQQLIAHWLDSHKKEAQWIFRGYTCAICLDSFTNKKILESHVQQRHHVEFVDNCMLLQCIPCKNHFGSSEELWAHVKSVHPNNFRTSNVPQQQSLPNPVEILQVQNISENNIVGSKMFVCRFCGLKFDLLPDLGRHHQAAHMAPNLAASKLGLRHYAYKLKSGRLSRPGFKKSLGHSSYIKNRNVASLKKHIHLSKSFNSNITVVNEQHRASLGSLAESNCSNIGKVLFSEIQKTKLRPSNFEIIAVSRAACCKVSLITSLEQKYGQLPERFCLKAAKLCSEQNIQVEWHREGFVCPKGCKFVKKSNLISPLVPLVDGVVQSQHMILSENTKNEWEVDECHCIIDSNCFRSGSSQKVTILCADISFGKEFVPVACVVDEELSNGCSKPWESFTYIMKPMTDQSLDLDGESLQLGCTCSRSSCSPETCDHVYLFDNDYEDAKDIYGKPMCSRFAYNDKGRIILEEGYLVYECNSMCNCNKTCPNRVLQNGVQVKLEVFKTENKGWAVRVGEPILRGTFVCELIGEVLDELEANKRRTSYGTDGGGYMFTVDAHINDISRLVEGQAKYVIDATKYGNVSRFINHSCSPNLVNYQVIVDSMDSQHAHIGLYAIRDNCQLTVAIRHHPEKGTNAYVELPSAEVPYAKFLSTAVSSEGQNFKLANSLRWAHVVILCFDGKTLR